MAENNRTDEINRTAENTRSAEQNRTVETNQTPEMNRDPAMLSLQSELEAMARETPEMPESFRRAWREAVRKEAAARRPRFALWRAALNFAAIALFILGGSILGRESLTLLRSSPVTAALKAESALQADSAPVAETALQADSAPKADAALQADSAPVVETALRADSSPRKEAGLRTESPLPSSLPSSLPTAMPELFGTAGETAIETACYESAAEMEEAEEIADEAMPEMAAAGSADRGEAPVAVGGAAANSMTAPMEDAAVLSEGAVGLSEDTAGLSEEAVSFSEDAADADSYVEDSKAVYGSSLSYTAIDDAAVPKAAANSPRPAVWLLGGILIGLAVFCWAFLLSTRKKAPKGGKKAQ